ncbi:MAG: serine/threonine protein kinase [Rhodospirillales bacterium]|nr:serine/threonine protein kinase [Rhodospirillales bacterium]
MPARTQVHGTCIAWKGTGVLLRGRPGSGKSDLALRLIEAGARLVADDRCDLARKGRRLIASAPATIRGLIEVRGVGIVRCPAIRSAPLGLVVDLVPRRRRVERMPEPAGFEALGVALPLLRLAPFDVSTAAKVRLAVENLGRGIIGHP